MNGLLSSVTPSQSVSTNSIMTNNGQLQQQNFFMPEKDEIWSGILKGVASSKMVPTKNVLILGEPGVGKSTLVHYLKNDPGPQQVSKFESDDNSPHFSATNNYTQTSTQLNEEKNDLALGYTFVDVKDEENEAIARLGLYQLALSSPEFLPLLRFAIRSETISDSCVLILIDWTRPWRFLETLERWINVLHHLIDDICKEGIAAETTWSKGKAIVDELREKLEHYLQTYTEPSNNGLTMTASTSSSSIPSTTASNFVPAPVLNTSVDQVVLPLTQGCLTNNLGMPITIVCCKSDALNTLEQTHDYKDDQFDFIQQTLRCICMKYGAALFYTSTLHPYTYHNLREYILHRVLTTSTKPYPFHIKAQVIERDTVLVPSGWDSWGKIKVLREGFDCENLSDGWDADMDAVIDRQSPGKLGARGIYEDSILNGDSEVQPQHIPTTTICEDEQSFFERHYETLQKTHESNRQGTGADHISRPGLVGPLGVSAAAMDMMRASDNDRHSKGVKNKTTPEKINTLNPLPPISTAPAAAAATSPSSTMNGQTGPSHEVLANFFQSLLSKKASSGGAASPTGTPSLLNGGPGGQPNGRSEEPASYRRPGISRKDVYKELDRMASK
ncbi:dynein light intermediate chain-domain-containing protein [Thamnidium elegans]|nr:dynein light intermediate chain-domain-containing protein [Thamnidium elegans]